MKKTIYIEGMMCEHCTAHVKSALSEIDGVESVEMNLGNGTAVVSLCAEVSENALADAVIKAGYKVIKFA